MSESKTKHTVKTEVVIDNKEKLAKQVQRELETAVSKSTKKLRAEPLEVGVKLSQKDVSRIKAELKDLHVAIPKIQQTVEVKVRPKVDDKALLSIPQTISNLSTKMPDWLKANDIIGKTFARLPQACKASVRLLAISLI
ncbi:hypothetical protein [Senimuribacter intestinalis]|uniref:hypothetical protein n=1 Tax=Senimuribacter intestinalis TaxID=2941507 RepID=UPI0020410CE6|nr:hypothetical protein [Senimuribacter intestinalis]